MAKDEVIDGGLWAGMHNEQYYGDGIRNLTKPYFPNTALGIRNNRLTQGSYEKYLAQFQNNQQQQSAINNQTAVVPSSGFDLSQFISENKWLVIGGVALLAYFMFFGGGGGLAESTTVKRYAVKK